MFVLCFALTAGVLSPVVRVNAEDQHESEAAEVTVEAEQIEESSVMEVSTELEANEEQSLTVSGNDVSSAEVSDDAVSEETVVSEVEAAEKTVVSETETEPVAEETADLSYTDENGNVFIYILDESGNATITGITVSGAALVVPEMINEAPVVAVDNANQCVVTNPGIRIPELIINCYTVGERAFYGTTIGTLTIGEDVKSFIVCNDGDYSYDYYYLQFAYAKIDKVVFQAVELVTGLNTGKSTDTFYGPFYRASIGDLEIGSGVTLVPEMLFCGASMELETLELQTERIGAFAFSGSGITIGQLILGEGVKCFEVFSNSSNLDHYWNQFSSANIGKLTFYANNLQMGRPVESNGSRDLFPPFQYATIGSLEIGSEITRIPEMFIYGAKITIEELRITQPVVEAYAFCGSNISIGTLILDSTLEIFEESYYSTNLFHHFQQFSYANIGTLKLYTPDLQVNKKYEKSTSCDVY